MSRLSSDDVAHIMQMKKESAARQIQAVFRRRHAKKKREVLKEQMREAAGMSKEEVEYMSKLVSKEEVE